MRPCRGQSVILRVRRPGSRLRVLRNQYHRIAFGFDRVV